MKLKKCPKCGSEKLGTRWSSKGRMLEQYCEDYEEAGCSWESEPFIPPKIHITNKTELSTDGHEGWYYNVYDKYGHIHTISSTYDTRTEAMIELTVELEPKQNHEDPCAPLTAVLFYVPPTVTIRGTMYKFKNGKVKRVLQKRKLLRHWSYLANQRTSPKMPVTNDSYGEPYC